MHFFSRVRLTAFFTALTLAASLHAQYTISTYAGGAAVPAQAVPFSIPFFPQSITMDRNGVIYVADQVGIYKLDGQGNLTRVAGNGTDGPPTPNALAVNTSLSFPTALAVDASGNIFVSTNAQVFKVTAATGIITVVAGTGSYGASGDGAAATSATFNGIFGVAVDSSGNVYVGDAGNNRVRKIASATGIVSTIAGTGAAGSVAGTNGDGGLARAAQLTAPQGLAFDTAGNLLIADAGDSRIRKVDAATQNISTVAGTTSIGTTGDGGPATSAQLLYPVAVFSDGSNNIYFADYTASVVRKVTAATGLISTVAGTGAHNFSGDGGAATGAALNGPYGVVVDSSNNVYIDDYYNYSIRKVDGVSGTISSLEGDGPAGDGGVAASAQVMYPHGLAVNAGGDLFVSEDHRIRKIVAGSTQVSTVPGTYGIYGSSVAVDSHGNLYFSTFNQVKKVDATTGGISTVAGNGSSGFSGDGTPATAATLSTVKGMAFDIAGNLYIADSFNQRIRKVDMSTGVITTVAGAGIAGYAGDNGQATQAALNSPEAIAFDSQGNLYIADAGNYRIRKVTIATGVITTFAGTGASGFSGDNGPAAAAQIGRPYGLLFDAGGELIFGDGATRVRRITRAGIISTMAGNGIYGFAGDGGPATSAEFKYAAAFAPAPSGSIYVADWNNLRVRVLTPAVFGTIDTPANNSSGAGAINVTGWALSQAGVTGVAIWRDSITGETPSSNGLVFLSSATIVPGARPDIAAAYPGYPGNTAGWGVQVLTNQLPNSNGTAGVGNGTYRIHAIATDANGQNFEVGAVVVTADNAHNVLPFGTIDTPAPGGTATGSTYVNFGWALTPSVANVIPKDGSTITVYIDNKPVGHPVYNQNRADIATLFPGLQNSNGAIGYYMIDTTKLTNGLHTISWSVTDSAGNSQGLGSRFFNVQN